MASAGNQSLNIAVRALNLASAQLKEIQRDLDETGKHADKSSGHMAGFGKALGGVSQIAGGFVLAQGLMKAPGFLMDAAKAAGEDEQATARLDQALRNAGGAFDENRAAVEARIKAGQGLAFTDDQVRDSFQVLLASTGDVSEALKRQTLAMDFARGAGIPLEQASKLLGKVTAENVEVFKRMGITIGEGATEAEAFAVIQGKFAGQAEVYAKSTSGQMEITKIRMDELKEQIGVSLMPVMAALTKLLVEKVVPAVESLVAWIQNDLTPQIQRFWTEYGPGITRFWEEDAKPALEALLANTQAFVGWVRDHWGEIWGVIGPVMAEIVAAIDLIGTTMANLISFITNVFQGDWSAAWQDLKDIFNEQWDFILATVKNFTDHLEGLAKVWGALGKAAGKALVQGIIDGINALIDKIPKLPNIPGAGRLGGLFEASIGGGEGEPTPPGTAPVIRDGWYWSVHPDTGQPWTPVAQVPPPGTVSPHTPLPWSSGPGHGAMSGANITINMPNYLGDRREVARELARELQMVFA